VTSFFTGESFSMPVAKHIRLQLEINRILTEAQRLEEKAKRDADNADSVTLPETGIRQVA